MKIGKVFTLDKSPRAPLCQRGGTNSSLWQREVRRDFLNKCFFSYETLRTGKLLAIVLLSALSLTVYSPAQGASEIPDCAIDLGPCTATAAGRQIIFDISPKPVKLMKELVFSITAIGRNTPPTLLLDLSMPGMFMGRNEVILKKAPDGSYRGKGILPRCPSGKKLWRAEVKIPGAGKASYTFNVSQ